MASNAVIKVNCFVVGMVQTNFYYLHREDSKEAIVFDPADLGDRLYEEMEKQGLKIKAIFLTHAHFDHIMGLEALKERSGAPVYACIHEKRLCESARLNQSQMIGRPCTVEPDFYLEDNQEVTVADITMKVLFTPGHTEGSCAYYIEDGNILISGDTLFQGSVGRSDLPTGDVRLCWNRSGHAFTFFRTIQPYSPDTVIRRRSVMKKSTTGLSGHDPHGTPSASTQHRWDLPQRKLNRRALRLNI